MAKIGIIGCGGMGNMHAQACLTSGVVELHAVGDEDVARAGKMAESLKCKAMTVQELIACDAVDAVMVCTPTPSHLPLAKAAMEAGKHVFLEKPLARTLAESNELMQTAQKTQRINQVGHVLRFWPEYVHLKKVLDSKELGDLISLKLTRVCARPGWAANNWYLDVAKSGGAALDLHLHDTDMVQFLLGMPSSVRSGGLQDECGWRMITTKYEYDGGPLVYGEGGWYNTEAYEFRMTYVAEFKEGVLDFDSSRADTLLLFPKSGSKQPVALPPIPETKPVEGINVTNLGGYLLQDTYFFECVKNNTPSTVSTFETGRNSIAIVEAEMQSAGSGNPVKPAV
ncbi:MAG: Gfo/Idh/MocA family oxidoreductase [bacterium]|nr:Gfo/Idh/MocA family oxidoreductase [bacterium]